MEHPYGKQYSQEGNPRAYMTMRDYRNLPYQWGNQQPVERNPNPPRSMREYRDQWMSAPVYHVPSTETSKAWDEPRPREDEGLRYPSNQGETIHTISEKTLMREKLIILTRRLDEMEMKNQHNIYSVNELSASQPSCYNHQSHGHYGENCQENVQILNQGRPPLNVPFGNPYIQNWKNHSNLPGKPYIPPTDQQQFTPTSQQQQPLSLSPVEQAVLDLGKVVNTNAEDQKVLNDQTNQRIAAFESSVNRNLSNIHAAISRLSNQFVHQEEENLEEESQEAECFTETILVEQAPLQSQEELKKESVEAPDELQDTLESGDTFWPWKKEDQTSALISEEESQEEECLNGPMVEEPCLQQPQEGLVENSESTDIGVVVCLWEKEDAIPLLLTEEAVEANKENIFPLPPTDSVYILPLPAQQSQPKTPTANAQDTKYPLPVAPLGDQVYILPTPAENPKPATPAPKAKSNPLHAMQNIKRLVASVHTFATTSKKMANAYIAWHSGWFGCRFGFGHPDLGISELH